MMLEEYLPAINITEFFIVCELLAGIISYLWNSLIPVSFPKNSDFDQISVYTIWQLSSGKKGPYPLVTGNKSCFIYSIYVFPNPLPIIGLSMEWDTIWVTEA